MAHTLANGGCKGVEEELVGRMVQKVGPWTRVQSCRGSLGVEDMISKMVHKVGHMVHSLPASYSFAGCVQVGDRPVVACPCAATHTNSSPARNSLPHLAELAVYR